MKKDSDTTKDNFLSILEEEFLNEDLDILDLDFYKQTNEELFLEWKRTKLNGILYILLYKNRKFLFNEVRKLQFIYNSILGDEDLLSIASVAFIKSCENFDCTKGTKLITYVSYWIHSELNREIRKHGYAINIPAYVWSDYVKLTKILKSGKYTTIEEILQKTGLTLEKYNQLMELQQNCLNMDYLDSYQNGFEQNILLDNEINFNKFNDGSFSEEEENVDKVLLVSNITKAMSALSEKEKDIILKRLCVDDEDKMTLREIAEKYKVSYQRVNEIEKRALNKLRNAPFLANYQNAIIKKNKYEENYTFKKDNISYIPSTQEIIHRIINLQTDGYNYTQMYEQYLVCSKQNGYKDFIPIEDFIEKFERYIQNNAED